MTALTQRVKAAASLARMPEAGFAPAAIDGGLSGAGVWVSSRKNWYMLAVIGRVQMRVPSLVRICCRKCRASNTPVIRRRRS